ncbi:MAG: transposase [Coriobacteriaceae bacterium]
MAGQPSSSPATWLKAYSFGVAREMPQAAQSVERFHLMQPFAKATDQLRCEERQAPTSGSSARARLKDVTAEGCEGLRDERGYARQLQLLRL